MRFFSIFKLLKKENMNKQELVSAIAEKAELTKADSEKALNAVVNSIKDALAKGESTQLIGFGTFSITERAARTGRNPQTGKEIQIAAKKVVKFKAGKALDEAVN
jgi:DNA-binding protein HU-beta